MADLYSAAYYGNAEVVREDIVSAWLITATNAASDIRSTPLPVGVAAVAAAVGVGADITPAPPVNAGQASLSSVGRMTSVATS